MKKSVLKAYLQVKLGFFPGLDKHLDQLLETLSPAEIFAICQTFPKVDWILSAFSPKELRAILARILKGSS
jgi:hypothetical protein